MTTTLEHDALIYGSDGEYVDRIVPFLRGGIAEGSGTVVVTDDRNRDALVRALDADAEHVMFVPSSDVYRSPVAAIAAYESVLDTFRRQGRPAVRAIGEVPYQVSERELAGWFRYESVAHAIFEDAPLHVICPYDARRLPLDLIEHARATHPTLHDAHGAAANPAFVPPHDVLRAYPERISFDLSPVPDLSLDVRDGDLARERSAIKRVFQRALPSERAEEATLATAELLSNGLRHGDGAVRAQAWMLPDALVCRVRNDGPPIDDLFAGYHPPRRPETGRMGLWIARHLADEMAIEHDARGPIVTLAFLR